jgi:serine/threonine protein kinase
VAGTAWDDTHPATGKVEPAGRTFVPDNRVAARYRIIRFIAAGGMGEVYEADDLVLGSPVALKVLHADLAASPRAIDRLRREVALARKVTHPGICRLHDIGEHDGRVFLTMELLGGETLAAGLARGPLSIDELARIATSLVEALAALHGAGVVHRDLKPSNVILDGERVVVTDFGLARSTAATDSSLTAESAFLGTPAYMAPEQVEGREATPASDIYALGALLYEAGSGRPPFREDTAMATATARLHKDPEPPGIDARWDATILGCLARDPAERFGRVEDVLGPAPRRRGRWWIVMAAAATLGIAVAIATWPSASDASPWVPKVEALPIFDENSPGPRLSPDGQWIAYLSDRERTSWWRVYVMRSDGSDDHPVSPPDLRLFDTLSWSPESDAVRVTDLATGELVRLPIDGGARTTMAAAFVIGSEQCGDAMVLQRNSVEGRPTCWSLVWRAPNGDERELVRARSGEWLGSARCDRTGEHILYARARRWSSTYPQSDLWMLETATGISRQLTHDGLRNFDPSFTPDGTIVFASGRRDSIDLWEMRPDGGEPRQLTHGGDNEIAPDVARDGRSLLYQVDVSSRPLFAHPPDGAIHRLVHSRLDLSMLAATPDGTEVIATDRASGADEIVAIRIADGAIRRIGDGSVAAITPDGRLIVRAIAGSPTRIVAVPRDGSGEPLLLGEVDARVVALRVGPDAIVHLALDRSGSFESWRLPLAGGPVERDAPAPWCFVFPAPTGGWTAWIRYQGMGIEIVGFVVLVPPGGIADPAAPGATIHGIGEFDAAGKVYVHQSENRVVRVDLATGTETPLFVSDTESIDLAVSPDGQIVYTAETVGQVRRERIVNFAKRPRLR